MAGKGRWCNERVRRVRADEVQGPVHQNYRDANNTAVSLARCHHRSPAPSVAVGRNGNTCLTNADMTDVWKLNQCRELHGDQNGYQYVNLIMRHRNYSYAVNNMQCYFEDQR